MFSFKAYLNKLLYVSFVGVFGLRINSSDMQCRCLSVWNVYFNCEHTFLPKLFFLRVWGVYIILMEILRAGKVFRFLKMEIDGS